MDRFDLLVLITIIIMCFGLLSGFLEYAIAGSVMFTVILNTDHRVKYHKKAVE